jgi:hypothetical protein
MSLGAASYLTVKCEMLEVILSCWMRFESFWIGHPFLSATSRSEGLYLIKGTLEIKSQCPITRDMS